MFCVSLGSTCAQSTKQVNSGQIAIPVWRSLVCLNNHNLCCIPTCGPLCLVAAKLPTICLWIIGCKTYICEPPVVHGSICKSKQLGWQQQQLCSQILIQKPPTKISFWKSVSWQWITSIEIVEPGLLEQWDSILLRPLLHMYLMKIDCPWIKVNLGFRAEWDLTIRKYFILGYAFNCYLHMKTFCFKPLSISDSHLMSLDKWEGLLVPPHFGIKL